MKAVQLNDFWTDLWGNVTGGASQAMNSVDQTRVALDQTTKTVNRVMLGIENAMYWLKPASIVAGVLLGTLVVQEIYLNHKEISKKK